MSQSSINVYVDDNLKQQFDNFCNNLGLTMSKAINIFIKAVLSENKMPFEIHSYAPNAVTKKAIEDVENGISYSVPYTNGRDITKFILESNDED